MAGIQVHATSGEQAIGNGKTLLQVKAAAAHRIKINGWGIGFKGTSATDQPVLVQLLRQTTAGTMTPGTTGTNISKKNDSDQEALQTTCQVNASAEPTAGDILMEMEVHPQNGFYFLFPPGQEVIVSQGGRLGIKVTSASLTYAATAEIDLEE